MSLNPPIALILDSSHPARLGEYALLPWWVHNVSGVEVAEVDIRVAVVGGVKGLELHPSHQQPLALLDGVIRRMSTPFKAIEPGHYAVRVQVGVRLRGGSQTLWDCPHEIGLAVSRPDAQGRVNMVFNQPSVIKGYLPPGDYTFNAEVLVKPEDTPPGAPPNPSTGVADQLPPSDRCLSIALESMAAPGLGASLDLKAYARHWKESGKPRLADLSFVDDQRRPRPGTALTGDTYRLRLQSYRGGCITLITQGSSSRFFQLAPHRHWGKQIAPPHAPLMFPDDILSNLSLRTDGARPDPESVTGKFPFAGHGTERALVIVSPQPLAEELEIFVGWEMVPREMEADYIRNLLAKVEVRSDLELGYEELTVRRPEAE